MILELTFRKKAWSYLGRKIVRFQEGVNLLVGPNGSGKSTVLGSAYAASKDPKGSKIKMRGKVRARLFDSENMNPRTVNFMDAMGSPSMFSLAWHGKSKSHGQALAPILTTMMENELKSQLKKRKKGESVVLLLDEPESGLDHDALKTFAEIVHRYRRRAQFIIATHSVWLWTHLEANLVVLGRDPKYAKKILEEWSTTPFNP